MSRAKAVLEPAGDRIACDRALKVAREDAEAVYPYLAHYWIRVALEEDGWHVDYELRDPRARGGGPHYVIDATTGQLLSKRYEQ
jgi:hypothetical protein